jgi:hypothetical protein
MSGILENGLTQRSLEEAAEPLREDTSEMEFDLEKCPITG